MKHDTATPTSAQASPKLVFLLSAGVLVLAAAGYWWTGSPRAPSATTPAANASAPATPLTDAAREFAAAADELSLHLKDQPDNAEGWATLARANVRLGRIDNVVSAFAKAVALQDKDARLFADYAEALAAANPQGLQGEPSRLIEAALRLDPADAKALALAGKAAFQRKDFPGALRHWERLREVLPDDSAYAAPLQAAIDQSRAQAGLDAGTAAGNGPSLRGYVRLSPAIAALAAPEDTVFIFARAVAGPRAPLALLRRQVKDLPLEFRLDDSTAMSPATRLSLHPKVVVGARVSRSGNATPSAGELTGQSIAVANNTEGLVIEVDQVVGN